MLNIHTRCEGAFIGHAIASDYDPSISMATNMSESLLICKQFNGPDILSRYLYLYHMKRCEIGETTKCLYELAVKKMPNRNSRSINSYEDFLFDQSVINESVETIHNRLDGYTAGCGPAQRSFPLAFCSWIDDDDLLDFSKNEATLTHYHPLAGQVAGVVNYICRSLLKNMSWHDAIQSAFSLPRLEPDVLDANSRYSRFSQPLKKTHPAYAPTVLNTALHYISNANNAMEAIQSTRTKDGYYCAPVVGILAGVRWGIPLDAYRDKRNDEQFQKIHDMANKLCNAWTSQTDHVVA